MLFLIRYSGFLTKKTVTVQLVFTNENLDKFYHPALPNIKRSLYCCMGVDIPSLLDPPIFKKITLAKKVIDSFWSTEFNTGHTHQIELYTYQNWISQFMADWQNKTKNGEELVLIPYEEESTPVNGCPMPMLFNLKDYKLIANPDAGNKRRI